jgi:hypothetical protein
MTTQSEYSSEYSSESSTECTICLLDYKEETKKITECCHTFHTECLDEWLQNNYTCPLCRNVLNQQTRFVDGLISTFGEPTFGQTLTLTIHRFGDIFNRQMREQYHSQEVNRINFSRLDHAIVELDVSNNGYTQEDSVLFRQEPVQQEPSGSIGITRVGSPFGLNVTYNDDPQPSEEVIYNSALHPSRSIMVGMGESSMYPNRMTLEALVRYGHITIEEVD